MPFDQFTIEQLAGDLLPKSTLDQKIATGFNRNHRGNGEGGIIAEEYAAEYVVDRVDTTATVWLGLTLGCARCHDHKYDPIPTKDYYSIAGVFLAVAGVGLSELHGLVSKSLVRRAGLGRFEVHELLRQYAAERLAAEQGELTGARERHARFYFEMIAARAEALLGEHMMEARDELRVEVDNLRAAAEWAVTEWSEGDARSVLSALQLFFWAHSWHEGSETFAQLADLLEHWERWAAETMESHLSYPVLSYFRSQHDNQSWLAALTTVLDASALVMVGIEGTCARQAELTFAMARHAVVDLAQVLRRRPRATRRPS